MSNANQRRRVIKLMAATMVASAVPAAVMAKVPDGRLHQWHGFALGAEVSLQLYHNDARAAQRIIEKSVKIIRHMEGLFSLYQSRSQLATLNRHGVLYDPDKAFVDLLQTADDISQKTSGAFDITVQPLWQFYKTRFSGKDRKAPLLSNALREVFSLIDYQKIHISPGEISFGRRGMAATLNGIAQGYVTDRVSDYLKAEGLTSVLVDIGEYRALGPQADGSPWRIGLMEPQNMAGLSHILDISQGAVATSSGIGDIFDERGEFHHMFDPRTGKSSHRYLSVTVTAPEATLADGLSTAFCAMSVADIKKCLQDMPQVKARLTDRTGAVIIV